MIDTSNENFSDAIIEFVHIDYLDLLKIEGVKGSFFNISESQIPENSVVVNESFAKRHGWKDVENKEIIFEPRTKDEKSKPVSGIFKDFHFHSLHQPIQPVILSVDKSSQYLNQNLLVKINMQNAQKAISTTLEVIQSHLPNKPLFCEFLDEDLNRAYEKEKRLGVLSLIISSVAILLATLGLIGLITFVSQMRLKEMSLRKVLGARMKDIIIIFGKDFSTTLIVADVIGASLGYLVMNRWLEKYPYGV